MKLKHLLIAIVSIFAIACQDNRDVVINEAPEQASSHFEQAMQDVMAIVAETNPKKYQQLTSIQSTLRPEYYTSATMVECLPASMRKKASSDDTANGLDTLLYIVNFGNDEGFAIMSANPEILGDMVLAVADSGSIYMDDFVAAAQEDNSTANSPARTVAGIINKGIYNFTTKKDSIDPFNPTAGLTPYKNYRHEYSSWVQTGKLNPLVKVKIGQGAPYNKYCFTTDGQKALAGCDAIAVVEVMAANEYPTCIGNINVNWRVLKSEYETNETQKDLLARIIAEVGKQCQMTYGVNVSTSNIKKAKTCLANYSRYKDLTIWYETDVTIDKVETMLLNARPPYFRANQKGAKTGHAWVLDGWIRQERDVEVYDGSKLIETYRESRKLVHCAYGWYGQYDGYYYFKLFDIGRGPEIRENGDVNTTGDTTYYNDGYAMMTYTL